MSLDFLKKCLESSQAKQDQPNVKVEPVIVAGKAYNFNKKYDDTMPAKAYAALARGGSLNAAAVECGIGLKTLEKWRVESPDFDLACEQGIAASIKKWEESGEENIENGRYNHNIWKHLLMSKSQLSEGNTVINLQADKDKINTVLGDLIAGKK